MPSSERGENPVYCSRATAQRAKTVFAGNPESVLESTSMNSFFMFYISWLGRYIDRLYTEQKPIQSAHT